MKSTEIKNKIKAKFNLKPRVKTGVSKNPYICVWFSYDAPEKFPLEFRQKCLRVIYGEDCKFAESGNAGNVAPHMISMHAHEWAKVFEN